MATVTNAVSPADQPAGRLRAAVMATSRVVRFRRLRLSSPPSSPKPSFPRATTPLPFSRPSRLRRRLPGPSDRRHRHRADRRYQWAQGRPAHHDHADGGGHRYDRPIPGYAAIGIAGPLLVLRPADAGLLGRRRMGRLHRLHRRMGAGGPTRLLGSFQQMQRLGGAAARVRRRRVGRDAARPGDDGSLGLARSLPAWRPARTGRHLDAPAHRRDAGL